MGQKHQLTCRQGETRASKLLPARPIPDESGESKNQKKAIKQEDSNANKTKQTTATSNQVNWITPEMKRGGREREVKEEVRIPVPDVPTSHRLYGPISERDSLTAWPLLCRGGNEPN